VERRKKRREVKMEKMREVGMGERSEDGKEEEKRV